jgi:hypothetical protein
LKPGLRHGCNASEWWALKEAKTNTQKDEDVDSREEDEHEENERRRKKSKEKKDEAKKNEKKKNKRKKKHQEEITRRNRWIKNKIRRSKQPKPIAIPTCDRLPADENLRPDKEMQRRYEVDKKGEVLNEARSTRPAPAIWTTRSRPGSG